MFFELFSAYFIDLLKGLQLTLQLVFLSLIFGFAFSLPLALMRISENHWLAKLSYGYIFFFRGTPLLVQLFLVYYGLAQFETVQNSWMWNAFLSSPYWCAIIALSLNAAAYMAEILYGGIRSIPNDQIEAARAIGMSRFLSIKRIIFPQAFRISLPNYSNEVILLIKGSSLASTITLMELTGVTRTLIAKTYQPIELYALAGLMYLVLNFTIARLFKVLENILMPYRKTQIPMQTTPAEKPLEQPAVLY